MPACSTRDTEISRNFDLFYECIFIIAETDFFAERIKVNCHKNSSHKNRELVIRGRQKSFAVENVYSTIINYN